MSIFLSQIVAIIIVCLISYFTPLLSDHFVACLLISVVLAIYFELKFYVQKYHFAGLFQQASLPDSPLPKKGNLSRLVVSLFLVGNFFVVGVLFYYPVRVHQLELMAPMVGFYTLHLILFIFGVRLQEKAQLSLSRNI
ncbi:MAG: hypothetical protein QE271_01755 [Bacteriovoracaceae bacterium]|nr:hypothetical protein [Bacteriovoracaceae bacterium]